MYATQTNARIHWAQPKEAAQHTDGMKLRLGILGGLILLLFLILIYRLTSVMIFSNAVEVSQTQNPLVGSMITRANIVDRNGELLATNLSTSSLYANPKEVLDIEEVSLKISKLFPELSQAKLRAKLSSNRSFIWIKRNLTPKQQKAVHYLGLPGVYFQREERRLYPYGNATGHVVGHTNIDLEGSAGIERQYNQRLTGQEKSLELTLDIRVQNVVRQALLKAIDTYSAKGGSGIVMDVKTGEILAMVSAPDFDPHLPGGAPQENLFNVNTLGIYEMGSLFKIFTMAMGLDSGKVSLTDGFDATKDIRVGKFRITDFRGKKRWLSVPEIFMYSSNIGTIKIMQEVGKDYQWDFFQKLGFMDPVNLDFPEIGLPNLPNEWKEINAMTASYGYGIAISPLHMITAVAAMVNGGELKSPTLLKQKTPTVGKRVISARTSDKMRRLLHLGVKQGTSRKSDVKGYVVGGKTGSANKHHQGGYKKKEHLASVVAVFPMTSPKYIILLTLDEPKGTKETFGYATGGWTAAPMAQEVIKSIGPMLGVLPKNESAPDVKEAMYIKVKPYEQERAIG